MFNVTRIEVWMAVIDDRPGGLADTLEGLAKAGVDLEFILARRSGQESGKGLVFLTPLEGAEQVEAAKKLGFYQDPKIQSVLVEGKDEPGVAARIVRTLGREGINLRGLSAGARGGRGFMYLSFDSEEDAAKAERVLSTLS